MKKHDWLLTICDDLAEYAHRNNLPKLALAIGVAKHTAEYEIGLLDDLSSTKPDKLANGSAQRSQDYPENVVTIHPQHSSEHLDTFALVDATC